MVSAVPVSPLAPFNEARKLVTSPELQELPFQTSQADFPSLPIGPLNPLAPIVRVPPE